MFINISPTLTFTMETENNNHINFLDITIQKSGHEINFNIYRKPTTIDTIIPYDSCHTPEQKFAALRYLTHRLTNYPISITNKENKYCTIQQILHKNKFPTHHLDNTVSKKDTKCCIQRTDEMHDARTPIKWATFTYTGKQTKYITKLLKNTNLKIAYKTKNTVGLLTQQHNKHHYTNQNKFQKSGVYQLVYKDSNRKYTGQISHSFNTRFKEHFWDYKCNNGKSNFAQHLIDNNHTLGPMEIMNTVYITKKGKLMDTLERFHIYDEVKRNNEINDKNTVHQNIIFDKILHASMDRGHPTH